MLRKLKLLIIWLGVGIATGGLLRCAGQPPIEEYTLARSAQRYAAQAEAARFATSYWNEAEEAYKKAEVLFADRYYDKAKTLFLNARKLYEKAENRTVLQKFKTGENF